MQRGFALGRGMGGAGQDHGQGYCSIFHAVSGLTRARGAFQEARKDYPLGSPRILQFSRY